MDFVRGSLTFLLFLLLSVNFSYALDQNVTQQQKAADCLNSSLQIISYLNESGFSTVRLADLYQEASSLYLAQISLKGKGDFSTVTKRCDEISNLQELALSSSDLLESLKKFYQESLSSQIDTTNVDVTMLEIESEIKNERYERVASLIDMAYEQISTLRAENTQLTLFFKATGSGLKSFVLKHRLEIAIIIVLFLSLFLIYRVAVKKWILEKKIQKLEIRKSSLNDLIKKTQFNYFQKGSVSESDYNIRVKNFAELVRDIDRQLPLLREEYLKLSRKVTK